MKSPTNKKSVNVVSNDCLKPWISNRADSTIEEEEGRHVTLSHEPLLRSNFGLDVVEDVVDCIYCNNVVARKNEKR